MYVYADMYVNSVFPTEPVMKCFVIPPNSKIVKSVKKSKDPNSTKFDILQLVTKCVPHL